MYAYEGAGHYDVTGYGVSGNNQHILFVGRLVSTAAAESSTNLQTELYGTASAFVMVVVSNANAGATTWYARKQSSRIFTITIPAGGTGTFTATGSATFALGDLGGTCWGSSPSETKFSGIFLVMDELSHASGGWASTGKYYVAPGTTSNLLAYRCYDWSINQTQVFLKLFQAETISYLRCRVSQNSSDGSSTFGAYVNGAMSALTVTIPSRTTGVYTNTNTQVSTISGDYMTYATTVNVNGGITVCQPACLMISSGMKIVRGVGMNLTQISMSEGYGPWICYRNALTLAQAQRPAYFDHKMTGFQLYAATNTCTVEKSWKNIVNGDVKSTLVSIPALTTGFFINESQEDSVIAGDLICYYIGPWGGAGEVGTQGTYYLSEYISSGHPYIKRVQGIPGMRTFSQLGHGGL
jgi:hypothetical protein